MADELTPPRSSSIEHVGRSGIYPMSGPWPPGNAPVVGQGELAHPEERRQRGRIGRIAIMTSGMLILLGGLSFILYRARLARTKSYRVHVANRLRAINDSGAFSESY